MLANRYDDFIRVLLYRLDAPIPERDPDDLRAILSGSVEAPATVAVSEGDVHEALAALKSPCRSKDDLRYQLAAAVVLNAWIESERRLGYPQRKRFYAFKQQVDQLARRVLTSAEKDIAMWREDSSIPNSPILFIRVDNVDFSFHAIPLARELPDGAGRLAWSGVRLKPIAPLVLAWARELRSSPRATER